jgi:hypothetical protein
MMEIEQLNETQKALIDKLQAEVDQLKIDQHPGETGTTTTTATDSESNRQLSGEEAADSNADSGATG